MSRDRCVTLVCYFYCVNKLIGVFHIMTKVCSKCSLEKPKDEFPWKLKSKGYLKAWCKSCDAERLREWLKTDSGREYSRKADERREASGKRKEHHRRKAMRSKYGLEPSDFQELLEDQGFRCSICEDTLDIDGRS